MIDFKLSAGNMVRKDTENVIVKGATVRLEYSLYKDEFPDPKDPGGSPITLWCLHTPQINQSYVDRSEELVFEALHEFFEEDFVRFFATKLAEAKIGKKL